MAGYALSLCNFTLGTPQARPGKVQYLRCKGLRQSGRLRRSRNNVNSSASRTHWKLSTHFSGASAPSIEHVQGAPSAGTEGLGEDIQVENGGVNTNLVMQNSRVSVPFRVVA